MRILLVDEGWTPTIYVATALEAAGHAVTVATAGGNAGHVRRRSVEWRSVSPLHSVALDRDLDGLAADADVVVPLTESVMSRVWARRPDWSDRVFPATDDRQRALVASKHRLVEHMRDAGIEVPAQWPLEASPATFPLVIKGATGALGTRVRIVRDDRELARALDDAHRVGGEWVAQEFIPSPTYLVGGVFHRGEPLRLYAAEKVEQHPPRTGPAIRLRSADCAALLELGVRAIRELGWTGIASADVMRRPDGRYVLLEINPRPWGSIAGALDAGVDLFTPFAELLAGRVPAADLAFAADRDCLIFPQYLRDARYRSVPGIVRAVRDLFGAQGREWLHPRFALHSLQRLYGVMGQWRGFQARVAEGAPTERIARDRP